MSDINMEIQNLITEYGDHIKQALTDHPKLEYLYALSDLRENVLEWFPFCRDGLLLQIGSDYGALTGLYSRRVGQVIVLDESKENLEINRQRYGNTGNIRYREGTLSEYPMCRNRTGQTGQREETCDEDMEVWPEQFDYIVFLGTLAPPFETQISAAKALLKPEGRLIVAACNPFGVKYWAGTTRDEHSLTRSQLLRLLTGADGKDGEAECYYPMPDYKLPSVIYSEHYLPGKGDLTDSILAYDYPDYMCIDVGATYDKVCEDNQFENFANSFLMIWRKHDTN